jgi:hypothetical protein
VFSNDIAAAILNMPLYDHVRTDRLVWKVERNGCYYTMRRLCVEELVDVSHLYRPANWRNIWRMCRGCLPNRVRLQDKGVACPMNCASCSHAYEDLPSVI